MVLKSSHVDMHEMIFTVLLFWFCAGADLSDTLMDRMVKPEWVL